MDNLGTRWTPDDLPEPPHQSEFTLPEVVWAIVFTGAIVAWIVGQQFLSWVDDAKGNPLPTLDPDLWSGWLPIIIVVLVATVVFEFVKFRTGRWTVRLAAAHTALNLAFAIPVIWLATTDRLFNPVFVDRLGETWTDVDPGNLNTIVIVSLVVITAWGVVEAWRGANRSR
jgi:hypothetical protein